MDLDTILLWFSKISLVFWVCVLAWCIISIARKSKKEKEWLKNYKPTLESNLDATKVRSWYTLSEMEKAKKKSSSTKPSAKRHEDEEQDFD